MKNPPLQPLHLSSVLNQTKLNHYARLTTEELMAPSNPENSGHSRPVLMEPSSTVTIVWQFFASAELMWINSLARCWRSCSAL